MSFRTAPANDAEGGALRGGGEKVVDAVDVHRHAFGPRLLHQLPQRRVEYRRPVIG